MNNAQGPFILGNGLGTVLVPGAYFGFGQTNPLVDTESSGPRWYAGVGDPNGNVLAPIGSLWTESVTGVLYQNIDGATTWNPIGTGSGATDLVFDSGYIAAPSATMDTGVLALPGGTVHLRYDLLSRSTGILTYTHLLGALNNDGVAANYISLRSLGDPAVGVLTPPIDRVAASRIIGSTPGAGSAANRFGLLSGGVPFYSSTQQKQLTGVSTDFRTAAGEEFVSTGAINRANVASVNRIAFAMEDGSNFAIGSRLMVYAQ